jgi:hypothetical protein
MKPENPLRPDAARIVRENTGATIPAPNTKNNSRFPAVSESDALSANRSRSGPGLHGRTRKPKNRPNRNEVTVEWCRLAHTLYRIAKVFWLILSFEGGEKPQKRWHMGFSDRFDQGFEGIQRSPGGSAPQLLILSFFQEPIKGRPGSVKVDSHQIQKNW